MREIKFRAWIKDKKVIQNVFIVEWAGTQVSSGFIKHINVDNNRYYSKDYTGGEENYILMQWTGLKDKNGKDIWEGDILYIDWRDSRYPPHINKYPVTWNTKNACWDLHEGGSPQNDALKYMEVIGNIYENPELLEKKNK